MTTVLNVSLPPSSPLPRPAKTSLIPDSASSINPNTFHSLSFSLSLDILSRAIPTHVYICICASTREIVDNPWHFYDVKMAGASFPTRHTLPRPRRSKNKTVIKITRVSEVASADAGDATDEKMLLVAELLFRRLPSDSWFYDPLFNGHTIVAFVTLHLEKYAF